MRKRQDPYEDRDLQLNDIAAFCSEHGLDFSCGDIIRGIESGSIDLTADDVTFCCLGITVTKEHIFDEQDDTMIDCDLVAELYGEEEEDDYV